MDFHLMTIYESDARLLECQNIEKKKLSFGEN